MTLRELMVKHPQMFYGQTWYLAEDFLDTPIPSDAPVTPPSDITYSTIPPEIIPFYVAQVWPASVYANLYILYPDDRIWAYYLWTSDHDAQGQRVYVGTNGKGFEIHRHLHMTERWGVPVWRN